MEKRILFVVLLGAAIWVGTPGGALAGGQEFGAPGAHSLGRGGAYYARSDNALALFYNPANLAAVNEHSFVFDSMATFYDLCVKRTGTYGSFAAGDDSEFGRVEDYENIPYPEVCNSAPPGTVPQLAFAFRPAKWFGFGFGVLAPPGIGHVRFGNPSNPLVNVNDPNGMIGRLPSPLRYMTVEQRAAAIYPTIGLGIAPHPRFRFGVAFGSGMAFYDTISYAQPYASEQIGRDIRSELSASTFFIPRVTGSVHIVPHDNLDIMGGMTWTGNQKATGELRLSAGQWSQFTDETRTVRQFSGQATIDDVVLRLPMAWSAVGGIRYAHRIRPRVFEKRSQEIEDALATEHWDIEFNVIYEKNSRLGNVVLEVPPGSEIVINGLGTFGVTDTVVQHGTKDQLGFRLGGDWNIVPGAFSLSLGGSYETSGASKPFMNVDYLPVQRIGAHIGLTARIARTDLSIAYARYFQETIDNRGQARLQPVASENYPPADEATINEGVYKSSLQLFSFMVAYHFR